MILKNSANRETIRLYLQHVSEDDLINKIVVPFYNSCGYSVLRIVDHGPGEHGKDVVLFRNSPALYDNEYIVIQAKAQRITVGNIVEMSHQLIRALRTPITGLSGGVTFYPNYVVHFNSQTISNDAHWEFPYLVDGKNNIKIINQDNVVDIIMNFSIVPAELNGQLMETEGNESIGINNRIKEVLYRNDSREIVLLFTNIIPISKQEIDPNTKRMIIDYIFKTWREDKSWTGTVKPMKWLSQCYDLISNDQLNYYKDVLYEFTTSTPSFDAQQYTQIVFNSITKEQYKIIKNIFMFFIGRELDFRNLQSPLINKFIAFTNILEENDENEIFIRNAILRLRELSAIQRRSEIEIQETENLDSHIRQRTRELSDLNFV